jgi:hypothetical protein
MGNTRTQAQLQEIEDIYKLAGTTRPDPRPSSDREIAGGNIKGLLQNAREG